MPVALTVYGLNTAYLAATASASAFYFANVVLHMALGLVLAVVLGRRLLGAWRRTNLFVRLTSVLCAAGALTGVAIMIVGAAGPLRRLLTLHIALSLAGAVPLVVYAAATRLPASIGRRRVAFGAICAALCLTIAGSVVGAVRADEGRRTKYRIANPLTPPQNMEGEGAGPGSPFFPSSADTNVRGIIPATFFMTSESCGRCHKELYEQWRSSMHHFSSFNNQWYRKSIEYMQDVVGTKPSKWCAGCHDHAVFFNGRFERPIKEQIDTPEAQAGLACTSCHSIAKVDSSMGNGGFTIAYPPLHRLAASRNPVIRAADRFLTYLDPEPHRRTFMKPFMREDSAEYCATCH